MKRFIFIVITFLGCSLSLEAQHTELKGRVVELYSGTEVSKVTIQIQSSSFSTITNEEGFFSILDSKLPQGNQIVLVEKQNYVTQRIPIIINSNETVNLDPILLEMDITKSEAEIGLISLSDNELADEDQIVSTTSGLLQASNDVFLNAAAFDFSAAFFRPRGLDNANNTLLINGIEMNKQYSGRPQWANWGGLNDVQRSREFSMGSKTNAGTFGDIAGTTHITMKASQYKKGGRISFATSNKTYEGRAIGTFHSGLMLGGWAYSVSVARRFGNEGFVNGTLYDANSFFTAVSKQLNEKHHLNLTGFYTPNRRGRSTAVTKEVKDLKGIRYNPNWGYQHGTLRNSSIRTVKEPILLLNHDWNITENTSLQTNLGYQFGVSGTTRIDYGGTRLITNNGEEAYIGGARNPFGNYYQRMPSYFLRSGNPSAYDYQLAYLAEQEFKSDGQLDWNALYLANAIAAETGGNSVYVLQEDRTDDSQLMLSSILNTRFSEAILCNAGVNFRNLKSENYALVKDLLGGKGYLDVDYFAEGETNEIITEVAQSDLQHRNRIAIEGDRYKYNYELTATVLSGFVQAQFVLPKIDGYLAASASQTAYRRIGLFENGNFPGSESFGPGEKLNFINFRLKAGTTYKFTGRHLVDANLVYLSKAPTLRNTFSNARQNNQVVIGLQSEKISGADLSYVYRSPLVKARLTGYYNTFANQTDINFYFTESVRGMETGSAFVQEILTGISSRRMGGELGVEAQITPTFKLKAAASVGQNVYTNNPKQYLTSDDFFGVTNVSGFENDILTLGDGTIQLKNYHVAAGPERAYQLGFEYRSPDYWWFGTTVNYLSNAYIDISTLRRSAAFTADFSGQLFNDLDADIAKNLLRQEEFDAYVLANAVGGKSWRIKQYYVGFFATINNFLNTKYITGGFESSRYADYRKVKEDSERENPVFGSRYFFGNGTTYYVNLYIRF